MGAYSTTPFHVDRFYGALLQRKEEGEWKVQEAREGGRGEEGGSSSLGLERNRKNWHLRKTSTSNAQ